MKLLCLMPSFVFLAWHTPIFQKKLTISKNNYLVLNQPKYYGIQTCLVFMKYDTCPTLSETFTRSKYNFVF